jgi:hypothetical protein
MDGYWGNRLGRYGLQPIHNLLFKIVTPKDKLGNQF